MTKDGEKKPKVSPINGQPVPTNPSGRPKGVPNKATMEFKDALKNLLDYAAPQMVDWLKEIDSAERRFDVLNKFVEYIHPKLARSEHTGLDGAPIEHKITQTDSEILERWKNKT